MSKKRKVILRNELINKTFIEVKEGKKDIAELYKILIPYIKITVRDSEYANEVLSRVLSYMPRLIELHNYKMKPIYRIYMICRGRVSDIKKKNTKKNDKGNRVIIFDTDLLSTDFDSDIDYFKEEERKEDLKDLNINLNLELEKLRCEFGDKTIDELLNGKLNIRSKDKRKKLQDYLIKNEVIRKHIRGG